MSANDNDIDALLALFARMAMSTNGELFKRRHAALTALVAERNALKQRVAELEAHPPADRELRERLDRITMRHAVQLADAILAAMRKEGGGA